MAQHKMSTTKLYRKWRSIKARCFVESNKSYKDYGGRGITVCMSWLKFENFRDWAFKSGYKEGLFIERVNNDGDYCPENCEWTTNAEQQRNKRNVIFDVVNGERLCLTEIAEKYDVTYSTVKYRYRQGLRGEDLLRKAHHGKRL